MINPIPLFKACSEQALIFSEWSLENYIERWYIDNRDELIQVVRIVYFQKYMSDAPMKNDIDDSSKGLEYSVQQQHVLFFSYRLLHIIPVTTS